MRVRYRIDGVLQEAATVPVSAVPAVISRIKILSDLDIAERRIPQDGRISLDVADKPIDLRVATLPAQYGEKVVMRILDQSKVMIQLEQLGMLPQALERFTKAFAQAHGAVLVTGPDRLRQVDLALRRAEPAQHDREAHHHDRGPGRVPARRHHAGPGQQQGGPDVRLRPALDDACRPGHHHGRRDPRPRDGADRHRGGADGPLGA